ncbi:MAG: HEPN domain-containing protein [Dehalococcoidia bacterium]
MDKADERLAGATREYRNGRYNNSANRSYYACFAAAIHALEEAGFRPLGARTTWSHERLQAAFVRELISRRKQYPSELRSVLLRNQELRLTADYERHLVTETQAARALRRAQGFVEAVQRGGVGQ